jgi:hypothetical protein
LNAWGTPADVFSRHLPNERTDFGQNRAPTAQLIAVRFPGPILAKALAVPTHQRIALMPQAFYRSAIAQSLVDSASDARADF